MKNFNGISCLQYFAVSFKGTVVNFVQKEFCFAKESFENRINWKV
jgi:hypothetical protein